MKNCFQHFAFSTILFVQDRFPTRGYVESGKTKTIFPLKAGKAVPKPAAKKAAMKVVMKLAMKVKATAMKVAGLIIF